jgi:hypothetical protein
VLAGQPEHVGVEEKEEDEADGEQVHVETEQDACLLEVPSLASHAAERIGAADDGDTCGNDEEWIGAVVGEAGEKIGDGKACEYERVTSKEGTVVRIENSGYHAVLKIGTAKDRLWRMDWLNVELKLHCR